MVDPSEIKSLIVRLAGELGFARVGVAPVEAHTGAEHFRRFLRRGYHGTMSYLARDPQRRCDVRNLLDEPDKPGSVICLAASYAPAGDEDSSGHIARYARGRDYHRLLRKRCGKIVAELSRIIPGLKARICVDTAPLLERGLAAAAGLGWIGRNGCLIDSRFGSYLLLAEIVVNLPLPANGPVKNRCGSCRACVDACPTGAIQDDGLVDSRRCVSYLTIEHRGSIPESLQRACGQCVFGCDICQEVCPFNRSVPDGDAELRGPAELASAPLGQILRWERADWDRATRGTPARRAKFEMFLRNAAIAAGNLACDSTDLAEVRQAGANERTCLSALEDLARYESPIVAQAARWALKRRFDADGDEGV
ncbi:MAG: tRNA epoxyqueuosine(34) reductase QueG [Planctomycetota bacterium]|nr:tRNA epoxyqueuosine(34) reductase QueG [Planctomycetota bacterium]